MLDFIEKNAENDEAYQCMERFYSRTLESFQSTNNERLWLKTNVKLARLWLDKKEYAQLVRKVQTLHKACRREDGTDDPSKGTYALEIYALEIQMYAETRNNKRLKVWYFSILVTTELIGLRHSTSGRCAFDLQYPIPKSWALSASAEVKCT